MNSDYASDAADDFVDDEVVVDDGGELEEESAPQQTRAPITARTLDDLEIELGSRIYDALAELLDATSLEALDFNDVLRGDPSLPTSALLEDLRAQLARTVALTNRRRNRCRSHHNRRPRHGKRNRGEKVPENSGGGGGEEGEEL